MLLPRERHNSAALAGVQIRHKQVDWRLIDVFSRSSYSRLAAFLVSTGGICLLRHGNRHFGTEAARPAGFVYPATVRSDSCPRTKEVGIFIIEDLPGCP